MVEFTQSKRSSVPDDVVICAFDVFFEQGVEVKGTKLEKIFALGLSGRRWHEELLEVGVELFNTILGRSRRERLAFLSAERADEVPRSTWIIPKVRCKTRDHNRRVVVLKGVYRVWNGVRWELHFRLQEGLYVAMLPRLLARWFKANPADVWEGKERLATGLQKVVKIWRHDEKVQPGKRAEVGRTSFLDKEKVFIWLREPTAREPPHSVLSLW